VRLALKVLSGFAAVVVALAVVLYARHGGGQPYPGVTGEPKLGEAALEVAVTSQEPIGNVAVSPDGRVFYTIHPESRPETVKLLEWREGRGQPYPSLEAQSLFDAVLGLAVDRQGRLWTIDHGKHGTARARLLAFDLSSGKVAHDHVFSPDEAQVGSFLQDLEVDAKGETVYIADVSFFRKNPGIVVYDVASGKARRRLERDPSVMPQDWIIRTPAREMKFLGGVVALKSGIDGVVLSNDDAWLYYAAMNHDTLYRVRTADLREPGLDDVALAKRIEKVGRKPLSDGLGIDQNGGVLVTDIEHGGVVRVSPDGTLATLVATPRVRWADGVANGPDGWLYLADSDIPDQMLRSKGHIRAHAPYFIWRLKPDVAGVPGR